MVKLFWGQLVGRDIIIFWILREIENCCIIKSWYHLWCIFNFLFNFLKCLSVVFNNMHLNFISIPSEMSGWTFLGSSLAQGYKDSIIWRKKKGIILSLFDMNLIKIIGHLEFLKILKIIISRPPSWAQKSLTSQRVSYGLKMKIHTEICHKNTFLTFLLS